MRTSVEIPRATSYELGRTPRILRHLIYAALLTAVTGGVGFTAHRFLGIETLSQASAAIPTETPIKPVIKPFYTNDPRHCEVDLGPQIFRPHCATPPLVVREAELTHRKSEANNHGSWGLTNPNQSVLIGKPTEVVTPISTPTVNQDLTVEKTPSPTMQDCNSFSSGDIQQELCWRAQGR